MFSTHVIIIFVVYLLVCCACAREMCVALSDDFFLVGSCRSATLPTVKSVLSVEAAETGWLSPRSLAEPPVVVEALRFKVRDV